MNTVTINDVELPVVAFRGQRCVTLEMIDAVHQRPPRTARGSFDRNRKRFIGKFVSTFNVLTNPAANEFASTLNVLANSDIPDFFELSADEVRRLKLLDLPPMQTKNVQLFTETGYLMLVKSFTDDLAWQVQRKVVNGYFSLKAALAERQAAVEAHDRLYFERYPERRVMRAMDLDGEPFWFIGRTVGRTAATVGKAIRDMIARHMIDPFRLKAARTGVGGLWARRRKYANQLTFSF